MYRASARGIHVIGVCVATCRRVGVMVYPVNVYVVKPPGGYGSFMAHFFENLVRLVTTVSHYIQQPCCLVVTFQVRFRTRSCTPLRAAACLSDAPGCPNQGRPDARRCTPPRQCAATAPDRFHWKVRLHTRSSPVRFGAPIPIQCARATQLVLGALPVPKLLAHVPDEGGNQRRPEAIRDDQRRSEAVIRGRIRCTHPSHPPYMGAATAS
jgi:hypothetical protein